MVLQRKEEIDITGSVFQSQLAAGKGTTDFAGLGQRPQ
jgi:hypothetical protein